MQVGTIQIGRRIINGQEKFFALAPWPQFAIIINDIVQSPSSPIHAINKRRHVQFTVENGYASYWLALLQVLDPHGLTYEIFDFSYSDPPPPSSDDPTNFSF